MTSTRPLSHSPEPMPPVLGKSAENFEAATTGQIAVFPKAKLPAQIDDFARASAKLIWETFPGRSQNAVCQLASQHLGVSPDTIDRILSGVTRHIDPRVMFLCLGIYQTRTGRAFPIGGGYEVRITQVGK